MIQQSVHLSKKYSTNSELLYLISVRRKLKTVMAFSLQSQFDSNIVELTKKMTHHSPEKYQSPKMLRK